VNELALFAGAGGGILAGHLLGWRTVCAVEWDAYAASVLVARQNDGLLPAFPIWDDVRTFDGRPWRGLVDVVSGGFPCQAYSSASRGRSVADDLWPEMRRVVADVAPRYVFAENTQRRAIDRAADDLEAMGYAVRCMPLSAADVGADHIRQRYWLLAHANDHGELRMCLDAEVAQLPGVRPGVWSAYPNESRVDDGLADRMERLASTGNGQVPAVAALAFTELLGAALRDVR
jgi:DNA (cytosine-5)-methyltransferase 1